MALAGEVKDSKLLDSAEVTITSSDRHPLEAYLARPKAAGKYPGLIVVHEAWGVNDHIRDVVRRFANVGFIAVAPDLYTRVGKPGAKDPMPDVLAKMFALNDAQIVQDLEAAAAFLRSQPGANGKVGAVGFCFGGRSVLLFASSSDKVDATVDCWGGFIDRATPDAQTTAARPRPVIDLGDRLHGPIYVVVGAEDQNPSPAHGDALKARLEKAGKQVTLEVFADAGHAFFADYRPTYREKAAFALWPKMTTFLKKHLA